MSESTLSPSETRWTLPGLQLTDLTLPVPLDHEAAGGPRIELFARVVTAPGGEDLPYLVYLQGGPGSEAPRPVDAATPSWLPRALRDFQVVLLDQRGTGRSTPVGLHAPLPGGAIPGAATLADAAPAEQARYLTHFRADAIARDAELLRAHLGVQRWTLLGQSFGGFTTLRYLSAHAGSVQTALLTGGLPSVGLDMITRSEAFWDRFPGDRDRFRRLADRAAAGTLRVPGGSVGVERLRRLGHLLGASGGQEKLHLLLGLDPDSPAFAHDLAAALPFSARNPLYAVVHESCWADGTATRWSAERTMPAAVAADPTLLAGEHMHHEAISEDPGLAPFAEAAEILAAHDWPRLYDEAALRAAEVPAAAAVYFGDAYVPRDLSLATAALLPQMRTWVTSEFEHNGLRASGGGVLDHLLDLAAGRRAA